MTRFNDTPDLFDPLPSADPDENSVLLHESAERDYLEYAIAVVKGRALPDVRDGLKPVQRRVLFAMRELGLSPNAKPVKSARVVGDVIGKFHPHGDASAYDAMVRIAQDFSLRYPLVDGQGNFGSRDGDGAAAMRYTEARLTPIAELLLGEIDEGATDFQPNYDGAFKEPVFLPARLPFSLINGASGIAVGMATEIPPHNMGEIAQAAIALIENPEASAGDLLSFLPGPDYPGGAQIISSADEIAAAYGKGRGGFCVRARYAFEEMARGAWQLVVSELPPGVSSARVLAEIGAIMNPVARAGKKSITQAAAQLKARFAALLERARDESGKDAAVRLVFEPASARVSRDEFAALLVKHTSLEITAPLNFVAIGLDGRPCQKTLRDLLSEWCAFRLETVRRKSAHRLLRTEERIHINEGRHLVFLNLDEVVRIVRASDEPRPELIARFHLSERQADDILDLRLRQLARLEGLRIEQELQKLRAEKSELEKLLASDRLLRRLVIREIESDAAKYGDARRTLIQPAAAIARQDVAAVADEPVTLIVSARYWARVQKGHGVNLANVAFKDGDSPGSAWECRSVDSLILLSTEGRAYTIPLSALPDGRGMGAPLASFIDLSGGKIAHALLGRPEDEWLFAKSSGYGFICALGDLMSRQKAGKAFLTMESGASILPPSRVAGKDHIAALSSGNHLLIFPLAEMKRLSGGKGVILIGLKEGETLMSAMAVRGNAVRLCGMLKNRAKETLSEEKHLGARARRGAAMMPLAEPKIVETDHC